MLQPIHCNLVSDFKILTSFCADICKLKGRDSAPFLKKSQRYAEEVLQDGCYNLEIIHGFVRWIISMDTSLNASVDTFLTPLGYFFGYFFGYPFGYFFRYLFGYLFGYLLSYLHEYLFGYLLGLLLLIPLWIYLWIIL